jgi:hypothetical protein
MTIMEDIVAYTLPSMIVGGISYLYMTRLFEFEKQRSKQEIVRSYSKEIIPQALQAYERLLLFLDRNSPDKIALRTPQGNLNNTQYTELLIQQIQQEFEHNLTQQLYVSNELWANIRGFLESNAMEIMTFSQNADKQGESLRETLIQTKRKTESIHSLLIQQIKSEFKDLLL